MASRCPVLNVTFTAPQRALKQARAGDEKTMSYAQLLEHIEDQSARIGVIGLGYVGLPVACMIARSGFQVTGIDVDTARIDVINSGVSPLRGEEPGIAELIAEVIASGRLKTTTDYALLADAQVVIVCVDTPIEADTHRPLYRRLRAVLSTLGTVLVDGALVIIESTIAPGTMETLVIPELEAASGKRAGVDFYVGHCPERVTPGKLLYNLTMVSRTIGGQTPEIAAIMIALYRQYIQAELDPTDLLTAEIVKTAENAYRDVQIAFANEVALVCEALGANVYEVRDLLNKSPGRNMLYPGAGVGGHCIPKDPWLLIANVSDTYQARLIPAARAVNDAMPHHVADMLAQALSEHGLSLQGARVAVLGYAFREDTDDDRDSPSMHLVEELRQRGAYPVVHDPYVPAYQVPLENVVQGANAVVVMVAHKPYKALDLAWLRERVATPIMIDGRSVFLQHAGQQHGFTIRGVGYGVPRSG